MIQPELVRHISQEDIQTFSSGIECGANPLKSIPHGAATQVYAASAPQLFGKRGTIFADAQIAPVEDGAEDFCKVLRFAIAAEAAERLWSVSEEIFATV